MARVFRRKGDPEWWLDFVDESGTRRRLKTTSTSKREAEDLLAEKRADIRRVELGLEVVPTSQVKTLGDAWSMWLNNWCPKQSLSREKRRYKANVENSWVAAMRLSELSGAILEKWFIELEKSTSGSTANGHRRIVRCVINTLIRKRLFRGVNPVKETQPREEKEYAYQTLTEAEMKLVLAQINDHWRDFFHFGFLTGLRRGEIYALRRDATVIDIEKKMITPRGSNDNDVVKGKKVRSIPLLPAAMEIINRLWVATQPGALLFPGPDGVSMRSENARPAEMLRRAMARAGLVESWLHVCRRPKCPGQASAPDEQQRKCEVCGNIMWPKPVVRHLRFHDIRHSTANHLLDQGVELANVQLMMRHSSIAITEKTYRHRTVEALRKSITQPSVAQLEKQLATLASGQSAEVAQLLAKVTEELALIRHQGSNVVPFLASKTTKK